MNCVQIVDLAIYISHSSNTGGKVMIPIIFIWIKKKKDGRLDSLKFVWYYLLTPPLGQDMTQGQFLSGV